MMLYGVSLGLGPIIVHLVLYLVNFSALVNTSAVVFGVFLAIIPLWPLTYIYAIYKHDLGALEFRANRLLGLYGFFSL